MNSSKKESSKNSAPGISSLDDYLDSFLFELRAHLSCHNDYEMFRNKSVLINSTEAVLEIMREWAEYRDE